MLKALLIPIIATLFPRRNPKLRQVPASPHDRRRLLRLPENILVEETRGGELVGENCSRGPTENVGEVFRARNVAVGGGGFGVGAGGVIGGPPRRVVW